MKPEEGDRARPTAFQRSIDGLRNDLRSSKIDGSGDRMRKLRPLHEFDLPASTWQVRRLPKGVDSVTTNRAILVHNHGLHAGWNMWRLSSQRGRAQFTVALRRKQMIITLGGRDGC